MESLFGVSTVLLAQIIGALSVISVIAILFLGLSLMWGLFNPNKLALHEQLSRTKLIDIRFNKLSDPPNEIQ